MEKYQQIHEKLVGLSYKPFQYVYMQLI